MPADEQSAPDEDVRLAEAPGGGDTQSDRRPPAAGRTTVAQSFDQHILLRAIGDSFVKLNPLRMMGNPVMFVVEVTTVWTTVLLVRNPGAFIGWVVAWLWFTLLFANFAEALAEGRGKAQADTLRQTRSETIARVRRSAGQVEQIGSSELRAGDVCIVEAGEVVPGDGEVIEGIASVDESAITGESAPVVREAGGDRSAVTGGTRVLSDQIVIRITSNPGETFLDRMIRLVEGADRQKTPNETALGVLLAGLTFVTLLVVTALQPMAIHLGDPQTIVVLVALFVCLAPTTIGGLLSAIGIAGMDRLVQHNVLAMSGRAVEAAGDCSTLLLDKTGTITYGNRIATNLVLTDQTDEQRLADTALLSSLADETPEGRSIVSLATERYGCEPRSIPGAQMVRFSAHTRMSGVDMPGADGHTRSIRKGAVDAISDWVQERDGSVPDTLSGIVRQIATAGGTPLAVADGPEILGVIDLRDTIKAGMVDRFAQLRRMGIRTVMVTGDNRLTAATIAHEAGVDDFLAEATPEQKLALIRREQRGGHMVAMTGDGTNDAPALAQADVGVAMNLGTQAAKEAGNMVDLDSDPTKLISIVEVGKQLLITRGSLTTFSIANDVAKYFAIIPAMFTVKYGFMHSLNVMHLNNPHSAILSAVIYNAVIIPALIPLALRGVRFRPLDGAAILRRNTLIYGVGGVIAPFVFIKLIDLAVSGLGLH